MKSSSVSRLEELKTIAMEKKLTSDCSSYWNSDANLSDSAKLLRTSGLFLKVSASLSVMAEGLTPTFSCFAHRGHAVLD